MSEHRHNDDYIVRSFCILNNKVSECVCIEHVVCLHCTTSLSVCLSVWVCLMVRLGYVPLIRLKPQGH